MSEVSDLMFEHVVRGVPVVREGGLVGIVRRRGLLRSISRADWIVEVEISHRWSVSVTGSRVSIVDMMCSVTVLSAPSTSTNSPSTFKLANARST
ncbi:CBS domain-containing protein [Nocardia sp. NRRL S-836]|uniref:CBS domain-containing protein n=1 Tax=Nocardia sp. NRRL S-836 TaxID=1519492 RepID=UPI0006ADB541|nr:CBS domain-containing protein [Nocardia sp. NRRL S-836]KOV87534.1 hypothetical protein ADL03_06340 [Nocardia sp. NRRL S-836]